MLIDSCGERPRSPSRSAARIVRRIKEAEGDRAVEVLESVPGIGAAVLASVVSEASRNGS